MIVDVGELTINISKVLIVGPMSGDPSYLRYTIYFEGDMKLEIYENRRDMSSFMPRKQFVALWKKSIAEEKVEG